MQAEPNAIVGERYEVLRELWSSGGVRTVEALHKHTGRRALLRVAIDASALLLARDAKLLAAVRHPNVMDVIDAGPTDDGGFFLAFEPNDGRSLEGLLAARSSFAYETAVTVAAAVGDALVRLAGSPLERLPPTVGDVFVALVGGREVVKVVVETRTGSMRPPALPAFPSPAGADARALADLFALMLGAAPDAPPQELESRLARLAPAALVDALRVASGTAAGRTPSSLEHLVRAFKDARGAATETALLRPPLRASQNELRRFERAEYLTPVVLKNGAEAVDGRSEDVSEGGMFVVTSSRIEPGTSLGVRFALPIDGRIVEVRAQVAWRKDGRGGPAGPTHALGLTFVGLAPEAATAIARYVTLMKR